ncbi:hypothetical protein SCORR_v1c08950 [Spiroplasma corruscae]|uniref:Uncharacterized protein n=1 Tax=Spiroplasma corruscae TaxID=216934 RepID=A0A222EQ67_9MOLU|nr:hypothetical protein [Spiroplasma corruscae]ASP28667.1 hypothetical protein SCORR_v1c08950 [Spiroplasma corruscae]
MIFDRVEILYEKFFLAIKIKFSETRKPTFVEFLILSILLEYKDDRKTLKEILEVDFNIKNQILFEKALRDLISFQIIKFKELTLSVGESNISLSINNFIIKDDIRKSFNSESFVISNSNKLYDIKYFFDPITKEPELTKEINWVRKLPKVKLSYKLKQNLINKSFFSKEKIYETVISFIKNNNDVIGNNPNVLDILTMEQQDISSFGNIEKLIKKENIACESSVEFYTDGSFKIRVNNNDLEIMFNSDKELKYEFIKTILKQYNQSLDNVFMLNDINNKNNFYKEVDLLSNINVNSNWNLLLVNDQHILSHEDLLKNNDLFKNMEYIIFYNSKRNSNDVIRKNNKIFYYVGALNSDFLKETTFTYLSNEDKIKSFLVSKIYLDKLETSFPVTYLAKVKELNIHNVLENYFIELENIFYNNLISQDYLISELYFKLLDRFGLIDKAKNSIIKFISESNNLVDDFNSFKSYIKKSKNIELQRIVKDITPKALAICLSKHDDDKKLSLISKIDINSKTSILKIIESIEMKLDINLTYKLIDYLFTKGIDGWELNINDCLNILLNYFKNNLRENNFDENKYKNSESYISHSRTLNMIATMIKYLYKENFALAEDIYYEFIDNFYNILNNYLVINKKYIDYLEVFAEILKEFYKDMFNYQVSYFSTLDKNQIKYKIFYIAANYIGKLEKKLNDHLKTWDESTPVEIKFFLLKLKDKESLETQQLIINNESKLKKALKIIFGTKFDYKPSILSEIRKELGEV